MKILFVVDSLCGGGAGRVVSRIANELVNSNHDVAILPLFSKEITYPVSKKVHVFSNFSDALSVSVRQRIKLIRRVACEFKADTVISFLSYINIYTILASLGSKWKTIISERNDPHLEPKTKSIRLLRHILYPFANGCVFQTIDAREYFAKNITRKGIVISNPVSEDIPPRYKGIRKRKIVSAGRLTAQKNYVLAINAVARVLYKYPEYIYEIYGEGEERENLVALINKLGMENRILLKGHVDNLMECIRDASVFLLSSDYEGMSNSLLEALAMGIPTISTNHPIGGAKSLIKTGYNGILTPINDENAMIDALEYLITNPNIAEEMGERAERLREELSVQNITQQWLSFISESC